jgi:fimbrial chaperone protein
MKRLLSFLFFPLLFSFTFSPMSETIELKGNRKGAQFTIKNEGSSNIAVELIVKERIMDEKGKEELKDTTEVSIFPPQIIVPPGVKRTIRVNYSGEDTPKIEKNFRVIAEQLPLNVDEKTKGNTGIKMLMKYVAALYAAPEGTKPEIKLLSQNSNGKEMTLVIENKGGRHQLINNPAIKYLHAGKKGEIKAQDLPGLAGENILAGHKRTFILETSKTIPEGARLELKFDE